MARKEFDLSGFIAVEARNAMKVEIARGDIYSVAVEAEAEIIDEVKVEVFGDKLKAKFETRWGHLGLLLKQTPSPRLIVTMPEIKSIELVAATRGSITGFTGIDRFQAELAGASKLNGNIQCRELKLEGGAASHFELSGSAATAVIDLSAASNANLENLTVGDATAKLVGAASLTLNITGKLDADISGASNLRWLGTPTIGDLKITGASSFSRK
ncbi:head GIN domain-containing protein [Dehalogenimonas sp. THU2]|uniref:head GIN domain-containing protein n=1 Tax=Dehalogenimonas sp. THU2 TaxID=3151121 RepID=UPI003218D483